MCDQTLQNSALRKWKFRAREKNNKFCAKKSKFCTHKMQTLHSKNALNRPPRIPLSENANSMSKIEILCLENANFALKKWKSFPMPWKVGFSPVFNDKSSNSALPCPSRNSALNSAILESWRDCVMLTTTRNFRDHLTILASHNRNRNSLQFLGFPHIMHTPLVCKLGLKSKRQEMLENSFAPFPIVNMNNNLNSWLYHV